MIWNDRSHDRPTRRTFVKTVAGAGLLGGITDVAGAQEQRFELDCSMAGWRATAPADIRGEINPTLELEAGTTYVIEWTNTDGFEHNFVVADREGNQLLRTGTVEEAGRSQIVKVTATEQMTRYFCEVHPATMRGNIDIAGREEESSPYDEEYEAIGPGESIGLERVAEGLVAPLGFETAPGLDDRQFVLDQPGQVRVLEEDGLREEPFIDIDGRIVDLGNEELRGYDERGLLGLAFHPEFRENRRFFVRYSAPRRPGTPEAFDHTDVLAEFRAAEDFESADPGTERTLWEVPSPQSNHNGGAVCFGPEDGYLYTSIGDGGDADDTGEGHVEDWYRPNEGGNGQDTTENLLGGIHRLDVDSEPSETSRNGGGGTAGDEGDRAYGIPDDNPFVGSDAGRDEYYAWGFRNPRTMSFDARGRLFVGDAGQNRFEEVSIVERGGNYGWNVKEGARCFSTDRPSAPADEVTGCPDATPEDVRGGEELLDPVIEYPHRFRTTAFIDGSVVIGGHVYDGDAIDHLQGKYVLGNWSGRGVVQRDGEIFAATDPNAGDGDGNGGSGGTDTAGGQGTWTLEELVVEGSRNGKLNRYVYAFGEDQAGELYVLTNTTFRPEGSGGEVYRLVPSGEGDQITDPGPLPGLGDEGDDGI